MARLVGPSFLALLLLCSAAAAQAMYSWKDKRGVVHYTDDPGAIPKDQQPKAKKTSGARIDTVKNDAPRTRGQAGSSPGSARPPGPEATQGAVPPPPPQPGAPSATSAQEARLAASIRSAESAKAHAQPNTWTPDREARLRSEKAQLEKLQAGHP
jgi:hypothetical protein